MKHRKRWIGWGTPLAMVLVAGLWFDHVRGPRPEAGPPPEGSEQRAAELLAAVGALLATDGGMVEGPEAPAGTWYVSVYRERRPRPVTVLVDGPFEQWAAPLAELDGGRVQVDLAVPSPPGPRPGPGGMGLDVGFDGWIEAGGDVHLPVQFLLDGFSRSELAAWMEAHPGELLRTWSWVAGEDGGALRMVRHSVDPGELTPALLRTRCDLGADYLAQHIDGRHRYHYAWDAREGRQGSGYNLLRHAGTTYSIFQVYNHTHREPHYAAAVDALKYLERKREHAQDDAGRCFEVSGKKVKLGGAGLTLLALVEQAVARPEDADWAWIHCLANHIVDQTTESGYMESFYTDDGRYLWSEHRSIYYPGEALLGLVRLYDIDPDPRWQECAVRSADFLVHERWHSLGIELQVPPDAWLIQALEVLHRQVPDPAYADYAFKLGDVLTRYQLVSDAAPVDIRGGRVSPGFPHVISTGSRGEGMSAAARLERRERPGKTFYLERLKANSRYALRNQYTEPILIGLRRPGRALGGFRNAADDPEIRIDGVQHNLSGLLGLLELLEETP
jgi:hypothetical protein